MEKRLKATHIPRFRVQANWEDCATIIGNKEIKK
jgi:hypothetical protein